jgi:hypothetical protein
MDPPERTRSFALIVDDPDAPSGDFVHWLLYRIPAGTARLEEDQPALPVLPDGTRQGRNGFGEIGYGGPQPPSGVHRYFFHLYALDNEPELPPGAGREDLVEAIRGHILKEANLMGKYEHRDSGSEAA